MHPHSWGDESKVSGDTVNLQCWPVRLQDRDNLKAALFKRVRTSKFQQQLTPPKHPSTAPKLENSALVSRSLEEFRDNARKVPKI